MLLTSEPLSIQLTLLPSEELERSFESTHVGVGVIKIALIPEINPLGSALRPWGVSPQVMQVRSNEKHTQLPSPFGTWQWVNIPFLGLE